LMKMFKTHGVDIVLHGHDHRNMEYERKGIRFVNGGASIISDDSSSLHLHLLHIDQKGIRVQHVEFPQVSQGQGSPSWQESSLSALTAA